MGVVVRWSVKHSQAKTHARGIKPVNIVIPSTSQSHIPIDQIHGLAIWRRRLDANRLACRGAHGQFGALAMIFHGITAAGLLFREVEAASLRQEQRPPINQGASRNRNMPNCSQLRRAGNW